MGFAEVVEWLLRRAQTKCVSCRRWRRLLDSFQDTLVIDPPDWSKCSHLREGPRCLFFLRNENDFHFRTGLLPSTRLPHYFFPIQTFINNLRRQCYVIRRKKKQLMCEPFKSNFTSYATAAGEMLWISGSATLVSPPQCAPKSVWHCACFSWNQLPSSFWKHKSRMKCRLEENHKCCCSVVKIYKKKKKSSNKNKQIQLNKACSWFWPPPTQHVVSVNSVFGPGQFQTYFL